MEEEKDEVNDLQHFMIPRDDHTGIHRALNPAGLLFCDASWLADG
jgi:hypothetical protein